MGERRPVREVGQRAQHPVLQHRQLTLLGGLLEQAEHDPGHQDLGNKNHVKALSELKHLLFLIKILNMGDTRHETAVPRHKMKDSKTFPISNLI